MGELITDIPPVSDEEQNVIEAAVAYVQTLHHGLFRDIPSRQLDLENAVQALLMEHDGRWTA